MPFDSWLKNQKQNSRGEASLSVPGKRFVWEVDQDYTLLETHEKKWLSMWERPYPPSKALVQTDTARLRYIHRFASE